MDERARVFGALPVVRVSVCSPLMRQGEGPLPPPR